MTYLQIVNKVLRLMREDEIASVVSPDDVVAALVCDFVNDAKRTVEDAHDWNVLRESISVNTAASNSSVGVTGAGKYLRIEDVYDSAGIALKEITNKRMTRLKALAGPDDNPRYYCVNGVDGSGDVKLMLHPTPASVAPLTVTAFVAQADLAADADELDVPVQPVVYLALALAARERGEVGGQTAAEIFLMADRYLSDAIAKDVALTEYEYDWYSN